jgi:hypothetical protein
MTSKDPTIRRGQASPLGHDRRGDPCPVSFVPSYTQPSEAIDAGIPRFFDLQPKRTRACRTIPGLGRKSDRKNVLSSLVTLRYGQAASEPPSEHSDCWSLWAHIFPRQEFPLESLPAQDNGYNFELNASPVREDSMFQEPPKGLLHFVDAYQNSFPHDR